MLAWKQIAAVHHLSLSTTFQLASTRIAAPRRRAVPMPSMSLAIFEKCQENDFQFAQVRFLRVCQGALEEFPEIDTCRSR